jgi:hypothetical protein
MEQMNAVTAMELEAARRRENVLGDRESIEIVRGPRMKVDRPARREPAWLAATLSVVVGARAARG